MLQIKNIYKQYKTGNLEQQALDNVSLNLRDNEFVAILGPSGSGKTTLLNIIGGLDRYDKGDLIINEISTKKYKDRDWDSYRNHTIGFVFQSYNLIPHQNVLSNVELALTISGVPKSKRKKRALEALKKVGLAEHAHKKPNQLSGGQMQRVAIARALVNNPDIVLADEPTGALDSDTSIQVMELLKEVAKDRLVVMVTHNPELAEKYATRIVNIRDGKILSDTNPYIVESEKDMSPSHKTLGKTTMSFLTSLSLSFNNLKTKKGRTILTAFAGSIGIIGIALILSLSNGVNEYIRSVEEDTLSEYPLQIQSSGIDLSSLVVGMSVDSNESQNEGDINVSEQITSMFSTIGSNDLKALKEYLESEECNVYDYAKDIEYSYDVNPLIYSSDTENLRQLNPDISFSSLGIGSSSSTNSMMSTMMSTDVFYSMPKDSNLYESQYDIKAGKWPEKYNECVLVLTSKGNISDFLLYTLGLREYSELEGFVEQFSKGKDVETPNNFDSYSYDEILGKTFKLINAYDCYEYDEEYKVWRNKKENTEYMKNVVENGEELKIVGIVQPKEGATSTMLRNGICYTAELTEHVIENAANSKIVKDQLANPEVNVFTGKRFGDKEDSSFDMNSLIDVDTGKIQSAFKIDQSKINVDFSNLNNILKENSLPELDLTDVLSKIKFSMSSEDIQKILKDFLTGYEDYMKEKPDVNIEQIGKQLSEYLSSKEVSELINKRVQEIIKENGSITITQEQMQSLMAEVLNGYEKYVEDNNLIKSEDLNKYLIEYLESDEAKQIVTNNISEIIKSQNIDKQISEIMEDYMQDVVSSMSKSLQKEMEKSIKNLSTSISKAISIDEKTFISAFKIKMSEEELSELFSSMMTKENVSYESNLKELNYASFDEPSGIDIYPKNFEGNNAITDLLNEYNTRMRENGEEDKVISYTDMVGTLMSSVTTIIDTISYVLIAFVAISLVVSSIMIGVITYISVLERKKEIGILRAMGASKHNVSQVFNAETIIIGALAGLIGIGVTVLLLIPTNSIIAAISNGANVRAILPFNAGVILVVLSIILTLIGGIIPSKKAAKEDPVLALRSE